MPKQPKKKREARQKQSTNRDIRSQQYTRLNADSHAFDDAAQLVEQRISSLGLRPDDSTSCAGPGSLPNNRIWESLKTASHYNLGVSFELSLKCLFVVWDVPIPRGPDGHSLVVLHNTLRQESPETAGQLERLYQEASDEIGTMKFVAFRSTTGKPPKPPRTPPIQTLQDICSYLDEDVMLATKRYSFETVGVGQPWRHYLDDLRVIGTLVGKLRGLGSDMARRAGLVAQVHR